MIKMKQDLRFERIKEYTKGDVLNLGGCGDELDLYLRENFGKVCSVDLKEGSTYVRDLNKKEWYIHDLFDTIVAGEIIEHILNPIQFLENCNVLLKQGGKLVLTTPNATSLVYLKNPSWCVDLDIKENSYGHIDCFTSGMLEYLFSKTNFEVIKVEYINDFMLNPIGRFIAFIIPKFRGDLLIVGKRK